MEQSQYTILGMDISDDFTQVAWYQPDMQEPSSLSVAEGEEEYRIPSIICKKENQPVWLLGESAKELAVIGKGYEVRHLLKKLEKSEEFEIEGAVYTAAELLKIYFQCVLEWAMERTGGERFSYITVSTEKLTKNLIDQVFLALSLLGYDKERVRVISYTESLIYYVLSQPKELRMNDVALFDFSKDNFTYRRMNVSRGTNPTIVQVDKEDLTEEIAFPKGLSQIEREAMDEEFAKMIGREFRHGIVSTVYLTGEGFYEEWAKESMKVICSKRRVFQGYNLYVKGAAYAGYMRYSGEYFENCVFYCQGRTKVDISLLVQHGQKQMPLLLSRAGTNWYEAGAIAEGILDNVSEIVFVMTSPITKQSENYKIDLHDFPVRPNKTTRVEIGLSYTSEEQCTILIKDKGFGELFKATGKTVRKMIKLQEWREE